MNISPVQADPNSETAGRQWPWALLALLICAVAITPQSLWNDEALTALKAMQPTLSGWWHEMTADKASDLQMPLYMLYMWGFAKIFGISELALRAANIPWFVGGFAAFITALPRPKKSALAMIVLFSPFAWYYLSEARPYAMQLGISLMVFAALYRLKKGETLSPKQEQWWFALFCFGIIALSGSSLLGMIWAAAACLAALWMCSRRQAVELARNHLIVSLLSLALLVGTALYYIWTLKQGARASDVGRTDTRNLLFIIYELLGFGGLGPGRLEIRTDGLAAFVPFAKWLVIYGVLVCDVLILGTWRIYRSQSRKNILMLALITLLPIAIILAAGYLKEFRVLGRHFTPLIPVIVFMLALGLQARWSRPHWLSKPLAIAFLIMTFLSCLFFRFALRHERDDYRGAASVANASLQAHETVWWNAGREGALYYNVPLELRPDNSSRAVWLMNPSPEVLSNLPPPAFVITSKPNVYDVSGTIADFLGRGEYVRFMNLPAFTIWHLSSREINPLPHDLTAEFD